MQVGRRQPSQSLSRPQRHHTSRDNTQGCVSTLSEARLGRDAPHLHLGEVGCPSDVGTPARQLSQQCEQQAMELFPGSDGAGGRQNVVGIEWDTAHPEEEGQACGFGLSVAGATSKWPVHPSSTGHQRQPARGRRPVQRYGDDR